MDNITTLVVGSSGATGKQLVEQLHARGGKCKGDCKITRKVAQIMEK